MAFSYPATKLHEPPSLTVSEVGLFVMMGIGGFGVGVGLGVGVGVGAGVGVGFGVTCGVSEGGTMMTEGTDWVTGGSMISTVCSGV